MAKYDFDSAVERRGTDCVKHDTLPQHFGCDGLVPLWVADMDFRVCPEIAEALSRRMDHPVYGYTAPPESYWQSILRWNRERHGLELDRSEIAFVPGVVRGIAYAVNFFARPGDSIVIQPPVYHPFRIVPEGNGRKIIENPLIERSDDGGPFYRMDLEGLERIFATRSPRMMILCNPHNPCGIQWDAETLASVARLAARYGVIVISDEIHGDLMLGGKRHIPFLTVCPEAAETCITFGAPSKTFNIAGLESSWVAVRNPALREPFFRWLEVNEFSSPSFTSWIGAEAAYTHGAQWLDELTEYLQGNALAVKRFCEEHLPGIKAVMPDASFLVWLDCRGLGLSQSGLVDLFVRDAGLALNDGSMFGTGGEGFMRLNIGMPRAGLMKAMEQLRQALA